MSKRLDLQNQIFNIAGQPFDLASVEQTQEILTRLLGISSLTRVHSLLALILEYRHLADMQGSSGGVNLAVTVDELAQALHVAGNDIDSQVIASPVLGEPELEVYKQELADIVSRLYNLENALRRVDVSRRAAHAHD